MFFTRIRLCVHSVIWQDSWSTWKAKVLHGIQHLFTFGWVFFSASFFSLCFAGYLCTGCTIVNCGLFGWLSYKTQNKLLGLIYIKTKYEINDILRYMLL